MHINDRNVHLRRDRLGVVHRLRTMEAVLALEDGTWFRGVAAGAEGEAGGEVVFNTSMTGYQEVLTDPSYAGQIVTMTCPEIGNYGVSPDDVESRAPQVAGFIIREESPVASNWRAAGHAARLPRRQPDRRHRRHRHARADAAAAVGRRDARRHRDRRSASIRRRSSSAPTRFRRWKGRIWCAASRRRRRSTGREEDPDEFGVAPARRPTRRLKIAAYDFGMKWNILRRLSAHGCDVRVYPATTPAPELLATAPDGVFLSNGPGDPAPLTYAIDNAKALVDADVPSFGICLGHQILGLAMGGSTFKLKFGHRGANHPVKKLETGKIEITSQNHGFAVDPASLPADVAVTHVNLYDGTVEGLRHRTRPVFSVQYHPEASPGPHDADYLFDDFITLIEEAGG